MTKNNKSSENGNLREKQMFQNGCNPEKYSEIADISGARLCEFICYEDQMSYL